MAYTKGGVRDTDGTRRKSGGKVEKGRRKKSGREGQKEKKEQNPAEIKGKGGWPSAGAGREPSPRLSHDLSIT